jgi:hypothetical protein
LFVVRSVIGIQQNILRLVVADVDIPIVVNDQSGKTANIVTATLIYDFDVPLSLCNDPLR